MAGFFSSMAGKLRSSRAKGMPDSDVYTYDDMPDRLRVQIVHLFQDAVGAEVPMFQSMRTENPWDEIQTLVASEHGRMTLLLDGGQRSDAYTNCRNYVLGGQTSDVLDLVEVVARYIDLGLRENYGHQTRYAKIEAEEALPLLNHRFLQNAFGYQYQSGELVRIDSNLLHQEATVPALRFLATKGFEGPNAEFLAAHDHYQHQRIEPAIQEALKAFESTMKAICTLRGWTFSPKAAAGELIKTVTDNNLVPVWNKEQLDAVAKMLIGLATVRNKVAGHGTGPAPRDVQEHMAAYALHLAASNILFLIECHNKLP